MSQYILIGIIACLATLSIIKKVNAYDAFLTGCKEGLELFYVVFPSMLAMLFCVHIIQASSLFDLIATYTKHLIPGMPPSIYPMVLFRPISGSASLAVLIDLFKLEGVSSLASRMGSVIQGSTDTTFYVISLYFSSVGIKKIRHALPLSLCADVVAIALAIVLTLNFFSS